jgi:hypothetical protein
VAHLSDVECLRQLGRLSEKSELRCPNFTKLAGFRYTLVKLVHPLLFGRYQEVRKIGELQFEASRALTGFYQHIPTN